ncbi:MAG: NAD(P)H-binding protein [Chitinophagales bacterium]|nr:NAD(P)H-binding protein [Chitinophagales bacterium]
MKYAITGSLGHISKSIVQGLVKEGHDVTVLTNSPERVAAIEQLGAKAAVGNVENANFVTASFAGADAAYLMIPPNFGVSDWLGYQQKVADNLVAAVVANGVKYLVVLSSVGAHMGTGAGPVDGLAYLEKALEKYPELNVVNLRPSYFYYNLFSQIGMIKQMGIMGSTQPSSHKLVLTHTEDIADAALALLLKPDFTGHRVQYIASDDSNTWEQVAKTLGSAIGKPELPYVEFTDEQSRQGMLQAGLSTTIADGYTAMGKALRNGEMEADYWKNRPQQFGKVKLADFAKEFALAYNAS